MLKYAVLLFALVLGAQSANSHAFVANGDLNKLSESDRNLVKKLVKISKHDNLKKLTTACTASVIEKNILLTAGHCKEIFSEGGRFEINGVEAFTASKVATLSGLTDEQEVGPTPSPDPHDLSMILVKPDSGSESVISSEQIIKVATRAEVHAKSKQVIVAGYGSTDPTQPFKVGSEPILHAGYSVFIKSDFGSTTVVPFLDPDRNFLETTPYVQVVSIPLVYRIETNFKSNPVAVTQLRGEILIDHDHAIPLGGDSGSPAISLAGDDGPEVVGVLSQTSEKHQNNITLFNIQSALTSVPYFKKGVEDLEEHADLISRLFHEFDLVDDREVPKLDFKTTASRLMNESAMYSSVFD